MPDKREFVSPRPITPLEQQMWDIESVHYYHNCLYPMAFDLILEATDGSQWGVIFVKKWPHQYRDNGLVPATPEQQKAEENLPQQAEFGVDHSLQLINQQAVYYENGQELINSVLKLLLMRIDSVEPEHHIKVISNAEMQGLRSVPILLNKLATEKEIFADPTLRPATDPTGAHLFSAWSTEPELLQTVRDAMEQKTVTLGLEVVAHKNLLLDNKQRNQEFGELLQVPIGQSSSRR